MAANQLGQEAVVEMKLKAIETKYGVIYSRDALILNGTELSFYPFKFVVKTSLSLATCNPDLYGETDDNVEFIFSNIQRMTIYKADEFPNEKYSVSSFDLVGEESEKEYHNVILSTYDHVFDILGKYEVKYL
ncbi:hypothetical protein [Cronobacter sakazakii]|uniref:hypothetical protein n=1 Tax=Cronobacter sakazakii TaxID=28141 RepID=UPI0021AEAEB5|nr:hypothetical protein [Cronobacter sakazakii]